MKRVVVVAVLAVSMAAAGSAFACGNNTPRGAATVPTGSGPVPGAPTPKLPPGGSGIGVTR